MTEIQINRLEHKKKEDSIICAVCGFESEIIAKVDGKKLNAKSIMNTPLIERANNIDFTISGVDEDKAVKGIRKYYELD